MEISSAAGSESATAELVASLNAGDLVAAAAIFTRDACLITGGGTMVRGRDGIRGILRQLIAMGVEIEVETGRTVVAGEVALQATRWRTRFRRGDGGHHVRESVSRDVLRLVDGWWKFQIVEPWQ